MAGQEETTTARGKEEGETEKERLDRNFQELLQGLRVALPGVQFLFAFLLILPFQQGYAYTNSTQEKIYFATLIFTAIASACLIAPPVRHRILFRQGVKDWILFNSNKVVTVGFVFLALAITGAMILIADFVYDEVAAMAMAALVGGALAYLWFISAILERQREGKDSS